MQPWRESTSTLSAENRRLSKFAKEFVDSQSAPLGSYLRKLFGSREGESQSIPDRPGLGGTAQKEDDQLLAPRRGQRGPQGGEVGDLRRLGGGGGRHGGRRAGPLLSLVRPGQLWEGVGGGQPQYLSATYDFRCRHMGRRQTFIQCGSQSQWNTKNFGWATTFTGIPQIVV